jgi:hypothetical protein
MDFAQCLSCSARATAGRNFVEELRNYTGKLLAVSMMPSRCTTKNAPSLQIENLHALHEECECEQPRKEATNARKRQERAYCLCLYACAVICVRFHVR